MRQEITKDQSDAKWHLHPYTNAPELEQQGGLVVEKGDGIYVWDNAGNKYIEGMSGLWNVAVGFNEQRITDAIYEQMKVLPYYHTFRGRSHPSIMDLSQRLTSVGGFNMDKVVFTNSGSEANDAAIKLCWYYNNALGRKDKKIIISRRGAYHGSTIASGSLTGLTAVHNKFDLPIVNVMHTSLPYYKGCHYEEETELEFSKRMAANLEALIESLGADKVAAFIGEPIMGAGGVFFPPEGYWAQIQEVCRRHDVLLIADEVITGFGRTGKWFGCQKYGIEPDMVVFSKQLTSSYQPLGSILLNKQIAGVISKETGELGTFGHGFTSSGNPASAVAALVNIDIIENDGLIENAARMGEILKDQLEPLAQIKGVFDVRCDGLIGAIEFYDHKTTAFNDWNIGRGTAIASDVTEVAFKRGLILRAAGNAVTICPPLIINEDQIIELVDILKASIFDVL